VNTRHRIRARQYERQAEGYLELGLAQQALETLARLDDSHSPTPHALILKGRALASLARFAEALQPLSQAADKEPENIQIRLVLGWCHKRIARIDLAIGDMEQALRAEPQEAILHYNLACYLSLAGNKLRALSHLSRAVTIDPTYRNLVDSESDFDPLRSDADFQALLGIGV
jgi:tetratricopeptide (TPR) repeat protein